MKKHQEPKSVEEQVENLKEIGLIIENEEEAKKFLNNVSYFYLLFR
jgi:abortive infection bacteriophage resistance protein